MLRTVSPIACAAMPSRRSASPSVTLCRRSNRVSSSMTAGALEDWLRYRERSDISRILGAFWQLDERLRPPGPGRLGRCPPTSSAGGAEQQVQREVTVAGLR